MRSIRTLVAGSVITALAVTAMAVPAAAADKGHITVVNGIPGQKIDICIGSTNEIRSGLKYGGVYKKQLIGNKKLRFRKASSGTCKGAILAGKTIPFSSDTDKTVVVTRDLPHKVLVFDNGGLGTQPAADPDGAIAFRHAADHSWGTVYFQRRIWTIHSDEPVPPNLSADPDPNVYEKGDQYVGPTYASPNVRMQVRVVRPSGDPLLESPLFEAKALKRYEFIFVGSKAANDKLVRVISTLESAPLPG